MFAGRKRRSSNVKVMQLFHELKQQFPTVPDHIVNTCISSYVQAKAQGRSYNIAEYIESALAESNIDQMGRPSQQLDSPLLPSTSIPDSITTSAEKDCLSVTSATTQSSLVERNNTEMTESASSSNRKANQPSVPCAKQNELKIVAKRPDHLDIKSENVGNFESSIENKRNFNIQLSEKCRDIHKLLSSNVSDKPPRSPLGAKRLPAKNSPTKLDKSIILPDSSKQIHENISKSTDVNKSTDINKLTTNPKPESSCSSSQRQSVNDETSKTSLGAIKKELCSTPTQTTDTLINTPNVNLSFNVNLDVLQSPSNSRCTSVLSVTPSQPWLQTATSPRSFTSVNLTLRSPSNTPQDPIDITSHNAGMTYSTSNFDAEKGLGSRLQITVGPGGGGSVQAVRLRPRSFHQQESDQEVVPVRAGSLNNLAVNSEPPLLLKQKARLERLRTELNNGKTRYAHLKKEVEELEKKRLESNRMVDRELERQLEMEIKHLRTQCGKLEIDVFSDNDFYSNIYEGQRLRQRNQRRLPYPEPSPMPRMPPDIEGPKWNCGLCTFLNHPDLDKCEQCEMPRIVHGTKPTEAFNRNITIPHQQNLNIIDGSLSLRDIPSSLNITRPIGFVLDNNKPGMNMPQHIASSRSAPNILK